MNSVSKILLGALFFTFIIGSGMIFVVDLNSGVVTSELGNFNKTVNQYAVLSQTGNNLIASFNQTPTSPLGYLDAFISTGWYTLTGLTTVFGTVFNGIFGGVAASLGISELAWVFGIFLLAIIGVVS